MRTGGQCFFCTVVTLRVLRSQHCNLLCFILCFVVFPSLLVFCLHVLDYAQSKKNLSLCLDFKIWSQNGTALRYENGNLGLNLHRIEFGTLLDRLGDAPAWISKETVAGCPRRVANMRADMPS